MTIFTRHSVKCQRLWTLLQLADIEDIFKQLFSTKPEYSFCIFLELQVMKVWKDLFQKLTNSCGVCNKSSMVQLKFSLESTSGELIMESGKVELSFIVARSILCRCHRVYETHINIPGHGFLVNWIETFLIPATPERARVRDLFKVDRNSFDELPKLEEDFAQEISRTFLVSTKRRP